MTDDVRHDYTHLLNMLARSEVRSVLESDSKRFLGFKTRLPISAQIHTILDPRQSVMTHSQDLESRSYVNTLCLTPPTDLNGTALNVGLCEGKARA